MRYISEDWKRALDSDPPLVAAAAYDLEWEGPALVGTRIGVFDNEDDAERWLATGEPKPLDLHVSERKTGEASK